MEALWFLSIPFALSIGSPDDDALALQSCNLVNRFTDAVQTYNRHTMCTHAILLKTTQRDWCFNIFRSYCLDLLGTQFEGLDPHLGRLST